MKTPVSLPRIWGVVFYIYIYIFNLHFRIYIYIYSTYSWDMYMRDTQNIITLFPNGWIYLLHSAMHHMSKSNHNRNTLQRPLGTTCCLKHSSSSSTHWGRDKMDAISQTILSNAFSWMKMLEFRLKFHWSLFLRVQLTIFQHWFR